MSAGKQLERVRKICLALPESSERLSHGGPTFFVRKKVFTRFANDHHHDGRIAVWVSAPPGVQSQLLEADPETYFRPPYVGVRGWVGIELAKISVTDLRFHIHVAWEHVAPKTLLMKTAKTAKTAK